MPHSEVIQTIEVKIQEVDEVVAEEEVEETLSTILMQRKMQKPSEKTLLRILSLVMNKMLQEVVVVNQGEEVIEITEKDKGIEMIGTRLENKIIIRMP